MQIISLTGTDFLNVFYIVMPPINNADSSPVVLSYRVHGGT